MKIKKTSSQKVKISTLVAVIVVLLLSFMILLNTSSETSYLTSNTDHKETSDIERRTVLKAVPFTDIFKTSDYEIYSDKNVAIYLANTASIPKLIYKYKSKPEGRKLTDNFFIHVYVKDSTKLKGEARFANVDFTQTPEIIKTDETIYYIFQKDLVSSSYTESYIPIENIAYINTGRFKPKVGRSLDIRKLTLDNIPEDIISTGLEKLHFAIDQKAFTKIKEKRDDALSKGILISEDEDIVNGRISINNQEMQKVELRLKGDWTDHLKHESKWSYRFIMKDGNTFQGMRKFSIQHPTVRNYLWEWLFNKAVKDQGLIGLRYDFAQVNLTVTGSDTATKIPMGIMAIEESFDKILIENNKKREGIILGFDESLLWKDREKQRILGLENTAQSEELHSLINAQIKVFNENKVLADPALLKQFNTAKDLLDGLRQGHYQPSDVFDVDRLATFIALTNLFGGYHGLIWHNLRIYYNPITNKLEPISFDSNSGTRLTKILEYPLTKKDTVLQEKVLEKLKFVSSSDFINDLILNHNTKLEQLKTALRTEYTDAFDLEILAYNSNFIKKKINPAVLITADLLSYDSKQMDIAINNVSGYPVIINHLADQEGRVLSLNKDPIILKEETKATITFKLSDYFENAFVSKKNKKGAFHYPKDVGKLVISHHTQGVNSSRIAPIKPYGINPALQSHIAVYKKARKPNFNRFSFIEETQDKTLLFKEGTYLLEQDLIIPMGYKIQVAPNFILDFQNNASLISHSSITGKGTAEKPIQFYSSDGTGGGLFITNASQKSFLAHCIFDNLSNPQSEIWSVSGAVNFHESEVAISNSIFKNNRCEDGLNIIRTAFTMSDTRFEGTQSDAFDGDFVSGTLERCTFLDAGNDGIDISGSQLSINDITITNPSDKGISAGENSTINGEGVTITGGEIGVVSKDLSTINIRNLAITSTRLGLSAFQKKSEYGVATISIDALELHKVEVPHLIEVNSLLTIDKIAVETVSNNVIDQMYGKEYGKSSK